METTKTYYCENCGGVMEFDVDTQNIKCPNCGNEIEIELQIEKVEEHELTKRVMQSIKVQEKKSTSMECEGCGAVVEVDATSTATECPYCGSNYVMAKKQIEGIIPDGVIPFQIKKNDVGEVFRNWINGRKFAPQVLKTLYQSDKIQGIYIPFWTFDADVDARYTAMGGTRRKEVTTDKDGNEKTITKIDWHRTSGHVDEFFDDVLIRASDKLKQDLLNSLTYNTKDIPSYSPDYMSGYCAEVYTVSLEDAHKSAQNKMKNKMMDMCRADVRKTYDDVKDVKMNLSYKNETYKYVLLPVYSTVYLFKDKEYHVLINGQNGKVIGEYPKSYIKILAIVVFIIAIIAIVLYFAK